MKAVIFDMDGVIFDSERAYQVCWKIVAKERKLENADEVFYKCIGVNKIEDIVKEKTSLELKFQNLQLKTTKTNR